MADLTPPQNSLFLKNVSTKNNPDLVVVSKTDQQFLQ